MDLNALLLCARMVKRRMNPFVDYICRCPWQVVVLHPIAKVPLCMEFLHHVGSPNNHFINLSLESLRPLTVGYVGLVTDDVKY